MDKETRKVSFEFKVNVPVEMEPYGARWHYSAPHLLIDILAEQEPNGLKTIERGIDFYIESLQRRDPERLVQVLVDSGLPFTLVVTTDDFDDIEYHVKVPYNKARELEREREKVYAPTG